MQSELRHDLKTFWKKNSSSILYVLLRKLRLHLEFWLHYQLKANHSIKRFLVYQDCNLGYITWQNVLFFTLRDQNGYFVTLRDHNVHFVVCPETRNTVSFLWFSLLFSKEVATTLNRSKLLPTQVRLRSPHQNLRSTQPSVKSTH